MLFQNQWGRNQLKASPNHVLISWEEHKYPNKKKKKELKKKQKLKLKV
jgi:hypothetical protein